MSEVGGGTGHEEGGRRKGAATRCANTAEHQQPSTSYCSRHMSHLLRRLHIAHGFSPSQRQRRLGRRHGLHRDLHVLRHPALPGGCARMAGLPCRLAERRALEQTLEGERLSKALRLPARSASLS